LRTTLLSMAKSELHIPAASYTAVSSEQNLEARARAWAFVFDCYRKKEAASSPGSRPDDAKGSKHVRARDIIPKRS
jgi:hypothetical protein